MKQKNETVIITGGSSGIGKATAELFLENNANVIIIDKVKILENNKITKKYNNIYFYEADVCDENQVKKVTGNILKKFKRIDILFNNAGLYYEKETLFLSLEEWEYVLKANLTSAFLCCKYMIPPMIKNRKGSIVNMSSTDAFQGEEKTSAYCASKAGIIALTKSMAREFAKYNIRVNCIAPGPILTPMFKKWNTLQDILYMKKSIPLGRIGTPKDIAKAVLFLASENASYITGKTLIIDGGII